MNIKLTIDRFEENKAILKTENGVSIIWPKNRLPENSHEGMILVFNITNDIKSEKNKKQLAKDILNEILNTNK